MNLIRRVWFNWMYLGKPPWDTGISPPELMVFIEKHPAGRALDLGCGTGTNAITLARAGWQVTGVDFAGKAIRQARRKAEQAGFQIHFLQGDVAKPELVSGPFDLILDIGCFHSLPARSKRDYADNLQSLLTPGGTFLMYAWITGEIEGGSGVTRSDLEELTRGKDEPGGSRRLHLIQRQDGDERGRRPSAWFIFRMEGNGETNDGGDHTL